MPAYDWQRRSTKYFGQVWVPIAELELRDTQGNLHGVAFQVDSGATVSLLRRSVAELLCVQLESGTRMHLDSVGGGTVAYLHAIYTQFGTHAHDVRFAISESENVPNLLGRLDVFDVFRIEFDPVLKQTSFRPGSTRRVMKSPVVVEKPNERDQHDPDCPDVASATCEAREP